MEFKFDCSILANCGRDGIGVITQDCLKRLSPKSLDKLKAMIDLMGEASRRAQKLPMVLTTYSKTVVGCDE